MNIPLNPYERYEITGMTDEEREFERFEAEQRRWEDYPDYEIDAIMEELEEIFDGEF